MSLTTERDPCRPSLGKAISNPWILLLLALLFGFHPLSPRVSSLPRKRADKVTPQSFKPRGTTVETVKTKCIL